MHPVTIPDILPSSLPPGSNFSLVAGSSLPSWKSCVQTQSLLGDFEEVYGGDDDGSSEPHTGHWDAILTCFFIDTVRGLHYNFAGKGLHLYFIAG